MMKTAWKSAVKTVLTSFLLAGSVTACGYGYNDGARTNVYDGDTLTVRQFDTGTYDANRYGDTRYQTDMEPELDDINDSPVRKAEQLRYYDYDDGR